MVFAAIDPSILGFSHKTLSDLTITPLQGLGILFLGGLAFVLVDYLRMLRLHAKLPPGPLPFPIVGNTFQLPAKKPWIYFESLSKTYQTPLLTYWIGRRPTVWINDAWTASELLDKRSTFNSRPRMVVFAEMTQQAGKNQVVLEYGEKWRTHRRLAHKGFGAQTVKGFRNLQDDESRVLVGSLMKSAKNYVLEYERYATSVVSIIGFGRRIPDCFDPIITEVIAVMQHAAILNVPGKSFPMLLETFPWMLKIPGNPWAKLTAKRRNARMFFYELASEAVKTSPVPSYSQELFNLQNELSLEDAELASLAGNLFGAGSDTTSSSLCTFTLACCVFPEAVEKAWKELDEVVGWDRSPTWEDEPRLTYVHAFVSEVLRWRSVAIIGGQPHAPISDEIYVHDDGTGNKKSWLIPKGTWTQGNLWAIHRHPRDFPDPDRFNPDRYLDGNPDQRPFPNNKGYMAFGWGRRVCSGQALAEQGLFITIARLLWAFHITPGLDPSTNQPFKLDIDNYTDGLNIRPKPFPANFIPRNERVAKAIEREEIEARGNLEVYERDTELRWSKF